MPPNVSRSNAFPVIACQNTKTQGMWRGKLERETNYFKRGRGIYRVPFLWFSDVHDDADIIIPVCIRSELISPSPLTPFLKCYVRPKKKLLCYMHQIEKLGRSFGVFFVCLFVFTYIYT